MKKPKTQQKENLHAVSDRDVFQTPNYAIDIIVPFLPDITHGNFIIWECAAGLGKIVNRLNHFGFHVYGSDLDGLHYPKHNFLTQSNGQNFSSIITNPPFSLKKKFYEQCRLYKVPFALLIPADYSGWIIKAVEKDGAEKIIPSRRIDYITPDILWRIHEGEIWTKIKSLYPKYKNLKKYKETNAILWNEILNAHKTYHMYESIYKCPSNLLRKYSSSQFHSMWLTWGFNLGQTETYVELTNETKGNI